MFLVTRSSLTAGLSALFPQLPRLSALHGLSSPALRVLGLPREADRRGVDEPFCSPPLRSPQLSVPVLREGGCVFYLPTTKTLTSR